MSCHPKTAGVARAACVAGDESQVPEYTAVGDVLLSKRFKSRESL